MKKIINWANPEYVIQQTFYHPKAKSEVEGAQNTHINAIYN
jgi:myo-inositol catabolism protein IolC